MKLLRTLLFGIVMTTFPALAQSPPTYGNVLPPSTVIGGKEIGELAVDLWNWVYSIGTNENPQLDCDSGQWATNQQPNPVVFFIAPVNGSRTNVCLRTFTVPENRHILMPVMPVTIDNIHTVPPKTVTGMRSDLNYVLTQPIDLYAFIDGSAVTNLIAHRYTAPEFSYIFPDADNTLAFFYNKPISGLIDPIIADGYWILLEPMEPGSHVLRAGGDNVAQSPHEVICTVQVEEVPLEQWAETLKAWVKSVDLRPASRGRLMAEVNAAQRLIRKQKIGTAIRRLRSFYAIASQSSKSPEPELARYAERMIVRAGKEL